MASLFKLGEVWACDLYGFGRVRLGKLKSAAQFNFAQIEKIEQAKRVGVELNALTLDWIRNAPDVLIKRLTHIGLLDKRLGHTLGDVLKIFRAQGGKASSIRIRNNAADKIESFFKLTTPLTDIKPADAQLYRDWLSTKGKEVAKGKDPAGLNPASVARQIKWARTVFTLARRYKWVGDNPFAEVATGKMSNSSRAFYVTPEISQKVLDELVGPQTRLLFALGRWGGLRLPSEIVNFRWSDVDWANWSMTFRSVKTEAYEGQEQRTCPIFKELQPYFLAAAEFRKDDDFIFTEMRSSKKNAREFLANLVEQALKRLGIEPWPRLLSNLRATRATEVDKAFGSKCESEWIGHGAVTALKHYLMVTSDDWEKATGVVKAQGSSRISTQAAKPGVP